MKKIGLFQEVINVDGETYVKYSSGRIGFLLAVIVACVISMLCTLNSGINLGDGLPLVLTLLAYSLGHKTFSKITELKFK